MIGDYFDKWKQTRSDIAKLQWFYVLLGVVLFMTAAIISLMNREIAFRILSIVGLVILTFSCNFVTWSAISSFVSIKKSRSTRR